MLRSLLALALAAPPALASTDEAWEVFREDVRAACAALAGDAGAVTIEVNPFGSETYGAALVEVTTATGTDCAICIVDKASGAAELTAPFTPED